VPDGGKAIRSGSRPRFAGQGRTSRPCHLAGEF
jgi:hypothetical protein